MEMTNTGKPVFVISSLTLGVTCDVSDTAMTKIHVKPASVRDGLHYRSLGLRDYLGARCLLLNGLHIQGATLASTALEKYLKCILATTHVKANVHLDQLQQFKNLAVRQGITLFDELDPVFVETLSKAYRLRYYDTIEVQVFGFLMWQLLGELDATVALIESRLTIGTANGNPALNPYHSAIDERDPSICAENHVVLSLSKKEFMEWSGPAVMLTVGGNNDELLITASEGMAVANYDGRIQSLVSISVVSGSGAAS